MTDPDDEEQMQQRLAAALRAQASGAGAIYQPVGPHPEPDTGPPAEPARYRLPAWAVLLLAVLFGALGGAVAGVISVW